MKLRKIVAVLTLVAMVCAMVPGVFAASSGSCGDGLTWSYSSGKLTISGTGAMDDFTSSTIPWKSQVASIKTVVIGDNVTTIGDSAFYNCSALTSVTMPDGITSIGSAAFSQCAALAAITLPADLETIGSYAFLGCSKLTKVVVPEGVETISSSVFYNCKAMTTVSLPSTLKEVKGNAFYGCAALATVNYTGSQADRAKLTISATGNSKLTGAAWNYSEAEHVCVYDQEVAAEKYLKSTATCTTYAVYYKSCTCGEFATTAATFNGTVMTQHIYENVEAVAGTCQSTGTSAGVKCSICGDVQSGCEPTGLGEHVPEEVPAVEATCTKPGLTAGERCSLCGLTLKLQSETPIAEHTSVEVPAVAATCTKTGLTKGAKCSVCQATLIAQTETEKLPHTPEVIPAVAATCTKTGLTEGSKCSKCGDILSPQTETALAPHVSETIPGTAATCAKSGLTDGSKCSVCDAVLTEQETIPATGEHGYVVTPAVAPTCTETGLTKGAKCPTCDEKVWIAQKVVDATGHTEVTLPAVAPTCGAEGKTEGKQCSVCDEITVEQKTVAATGKHTLAYVDAVEPTCTTEGLTRGRACTVCDYVAKAQEAIAKLPHTEETLEAVPATCLETGLTEGKICSVCETVLVEQEVVPLSDHTPVFTEAKEPTCEEDGYSSDTLICDVCGEFLLLQGVEPATGHTDATKIEDGMLIEYCSVCGEVFSEVPGFFQVGEEYFETLSAAVEAAEEGGTVTMLTDREGFGVVIDKDLTIDFGGFTYTVVGEKADGLVGSTGTETLGLQILKNHDVTLKNGTLAVGTDACKMLIQNYADLTLKDMTVDGTGSAQMQYVLSNNCGETSIEGETDIIAPEGAVAFDVYDYSSGGYTVPVVSVSTTGTITGAIEVSDTATLAISGGTFTVPVEESWCAEGFAPVEYEDGTYGVEEETIELLPADSIVARPVLGNAIDFQFGVRKTAVSDWTGCYAVVTKEVYGAEDEETVLPFEDWGEAGTFWAVEYSGMAAKEMNDQITMQLFDAQDRAISEEKVYSIRAYAERNYATQSDEYKTLLVDMLNYGAEAQKQFGYDTEHLANAFLTEDQQAMATQTVEVENKQVGGENFFMSRLVLESRIQLQFGFHNIDTDCYAVYTYTKHTGVEVEETAPVVAVGGSIYGVFVEDLDAADGRALVTVTVYNADGEEVASAADSVESYVARNGGTINEAIMKYCDAANAALH